MVFTIVVATRQEHSTLSDGEAVVIRMLVVSLADIVGIRMTNLFVVG